MTVLVISFEYTLFTNLVGFCLLCSGQHRIGVSESLFSSDFQVADVNVM